MEQLSRRSFLVGAASLGLAATAGLASCAPAAQGASTDAETWEKEADVVVVGCGAAGAAAALEASAAGASVIVLEKGVASGGASAISGQGFWAAGSSVQKEGGVDDSPEAGLAFLEAAFEGDHDLFEKLARESSANMQWLIDKGADYAPANLTIDGIDEEYDNPTPRVCYPSERLPWPILSGELDADKNIELITKNAVTALIQNDAGEVVGVVSQKGRYKARKGVVLCAGGYTANEDMIRSLISPYRVLSVPGENDSGDGIRLGQSVGAGVGYFGPACSLAYAETGDTCGLLTSFAAPPFEAPAIGINKLGARVGKEDAYYMAYSTSFVEKTDGEGWVVTAGENGLKSLRYDGYSGKEIDTPYVEATSAKELAAAIGADEEVLTSAIADWDAGCANGSDAAFGVTRNLVPFGDGPFYASAVNVSQASSMGGLRIDVNAQVLSALDGQPIPRLYGAGVNTMAVGRKYYSSGVCIATCIIFGRTAGANVAALEPLS